MDSKSLYETEEMGARGATHPRVSLDDIEKNIAFVAFKTADALLSPELPEDAARNAEPLKLLTLCVVVMANGFVVVGKSAPASPENFDAEKGQTFAYEDAVRQIWPLMGFALRDRLYRGHTAMEAYMRATGQARVTGQAETASTDESRYSGRGENPAQEEEDPTPEPDGDGDMAPEEQHENAANGGQPNPI